MFYRDTDYQKVATWLHFNLNFRFWKCRKNLCQPTSSVRPTGRNSPGQKFWRKWCLLCCSGTPSSSPQPGAATEGSLQQSMSSTDCSNVLSPHQGVEPTSEPILEDVELKLSHLEAVEFETAPEETPVLQQAMLPVPSCKSTWPSSVTVEKNNNTSASMLDEPCSELKLKARNLQNLVTEILNSALCEDTTCIHNFLGSYRYFTTTKQMLDVLFTWVLSSIFGTWLDYFSQDFHEPPHFPCLKLLLNYLGIYMPGSEVEVQTFLLLDHWEDMQPSEMEDLATAPILALQPNPEPEPNSSGAPEVELPPVEMPEYKTGPFGEPLRPQFLDMELDLIRENPSILDSPHDLVDHFILMESIETPPVSLQEESCHNEIPEAHNLGNFTDQIWTALLCGNTVFVYHIQGIYGCFTTTEHVLDILYTWDISSILGIWLYQYWENFDNSAEFPCLTLTTTYMQLQMSGIHEECEAQLFLVHWEYRVPSGAIYEATLTGLVMVPQPNAEPEPPPSEAQGFEPNPMPGPTTNSPGPMAEDMDVEWIDEDTKFIAMPQDLVQEHFLVVDDIENAPVSIQEDSWSNGIHTVGSLENLLEQLWIAMFLGDIIFFNHFLGIYGQFTTAEHVLHVLFTWLSSVDSFCESAWCDSHEADRPENKLKKALTYILHTWLNMYWEDFYEPSEFPCLKLMVVYLNLHMPGSEEMHLAQHLLFQWEFLEPSETAYEGLLTAQLLMLQPNAEPDPSPSEAQRFEPNPMPGPTISSPSPIPEDTELEIISDDTQLLTISEDHEEHFMVMSGGSGCAGQDGVGSHLFCSNVAFFGSQAFFPSEDPSCPGLISKEDEPMEEELYFLFS
ncbi:uncharacterized protein isoform X5 [Castor canadensis]|uniref:Uncharacterized protein isoform X5 n=2 Tax=Castor canadensis TaxID=51338 RepID=A0AC58KUL7_CASCN